MIMSIRRLLLLLPTLSAGSIVLFGCTAQEPQVAEELPGAFPVLKGPYLGQEPPGLEPRLFAPGVISTALHDDGSPRFSPEGTEVWFRKYAYPHDIVGHMKLENGIWSRPCMFRDFGRYVISAPRFSPDGKRAFFHSRRPRDGHGEPQDLDIWVAERTEHGWGELENLRAPVNTEQDEIFGSVSSDGTIYFTARYEDSLGAFDIYSSRLEEGHYRKTENLGEPVNSSGSEAGPSIAADGSCLVFSSLGRPDSFGALDLYVSFRAEDGSWSVPANLGEGINTKYNDKFPAISPDGKYLFFVSDRRDERSFIFSERTYDEMMSLNLGPRNGEGDVYWVDAAIIERLRPSPAPAQETPPAR